METTDNRPRTISGMPPKTWLVESILVTLFCCLPFGIAGIVYATKVESLFYAGHSEAAEQASRDAGKWTKIGFWVGLSLTVLTMLGYGIMIALGIAANVLDK